MVFCITKVKVGTGIKLNDRITSTGTFSMSGVVNIKLRTSFH